MKADLWSGFLSMWLIAEITGHVTWPVDWVCSWAATTIERYTDPMLISHKTDIRSIIFTYLPLLDEHTFVPSISSLWWYTNCWFLDCDDGDYHPSIRRGVEVFSCHDPVMAWCGTFRFVYGLIMSHVTTDVWGTENLRIHHYCYSPEHTRVSRRLPDLSRSGINFLQPHHRSSWFSLLLAIPLPVFVLIAPCPSCHYWHVITTPYPSPQIYHNPFPLLSGTLPLPCHPIFTPSWHLLDFFSYCGLVGHYHYNTS